jgi:AcrR family transcriptional regulator
MAGKSSRTASTAATPGIREAVKEETRAALIAAGAELFAQEGLDAPSLDAICARAGFTRGAFYVHFQGREDFIVAVMVAATGSFIDAILSVRGEAVDLQHIVAGFAAAVSGESFPVFGKVPLHQVLTACARSRVLRERYREIVSETRDRLAESVRAGQKQRRIRGDVDPFHTAGLLLAIAIGVGAVRELGVSFDAPEHAVTVLKLLKPEESREAQEH